MRWRVTVLTGLASVLAVSAFSQSLAEAAARERQRRKALAETRVYTETELRTSGRGAYPASGQQATPQPEASPAAAAGAAGQKSEEEVRSEQEQAWREKLQQATQDVERYQQQADELQRQLNDMTGNLYGAGRTKLLNELETAKQNLAQARQRVADLQEEGRRSRFRP